MPVRLRLTGMKVLVIVAVALVAGACGGDPARVAESIQPPPPSSSTSRAEVAPPERADPVPQEASRLPEPVTEPVLTPVPTPATGPTKPNRGLPTPPPPRTTPDRGAPDEASIELAVADLAFRLGVLEADIDLLDARRVTWRDGSVGCPSPGLAYTQAEVPGSLIVLRVGQVSYRYHAAADSAFFYCENPQAPLEGAA